MQQKHPQLGHFSVPSIIIGADVSHAAPGVDSPSMAAITVSLDRKRSLRALVQKIVELTEWTGFGGRYAAACETNGRRVEMITTNNIRRLVVPLVGHWIRTAGSGVLPQHVYYFRDGVSEGQYQHVLQQEIRDMRAAFKEKIPTWNVSIPSLTAPRSRLMANDGIAQVHCRGGVKASSYSILPKGG